MEINVFRQNLTSKEEEIFVSYLMPKTEAINDLLTKFSTDAVLLKVSIEKFDKHDAFAVEFCLVLPTKTFVAKEASHQITKAIDLTKDRLIAQIKKHLALLREDRSHKGIIQGRIRTKKKVEIDEFAFAE
jgi:ribosome-associated translation inhibitor RaiA